ncbi:MAG: VCBS repeat-containing protein [Candidatus Eisenbacteria bacterium]|nr:VCBS repeat-containing protein [Candidatus Eisenbacteria bacterium]
MSGAGIRTLSLPAFFRTLLLLLPLPLLLAAPLPARGVVPLIKPPDWRSIDGDYSTGGALADVDGDGYLDLVTGNGNDMARNPNRVYYNLGGMLERTASWSSADVGYHCHIDLGDMDGDGDLDLAVALLGDPGTPQYDKVYENQGGTFSSLPVWTSGDLDNSFDLAWGDADGDGDLDLAVACGETYTSVPQKSKLYRNDGGVLTTGAVWTTGPVDYSLDVAWGDLDGDGDLDLAVANEFGPNRVYRNNGAGLDSVPFWESADTENTLQLDWGDVNGDGLLDLAVANNGQLGGASDVRVYFNTGGTLEANASWICSDPKQYYSAVSLADADGDGDLDLASGGWWEHAVVYENLGGALEPTASFSYIFPNPAKGLVVESCVWGDLDNFGSVAVTGESKSGDGAAKVFYTENFPLRRIDAIRVNGNPVPYGAYAYDLDKGWISLASAPPAGSGNVEIDYVYSENLDLVVTNWDPDDPNIAFLHETATAIAAGAPPAAFVLLPNRPNPFNPATVLPFRVENPSRVALTVLDPSGRIVRTLFRGEVGAGDHEKVWDGTTDAGRSVASGVYLYRLDANGESVVRKMTLIR